ncbi:MAG: hypothetical protein U9N56_03430, partial [Actinomycetota bacterium]|nr:hypothetical protein [Actinomycetota bacterium]
MSDVFVVTEHLQGELTETSFELVAMAREVASQTGGQVVAGVVGSGVSDLAAQLGGADRIVVVDDPAFEYFSPDGYAAAFGSLIGDSAVVLVPYTSMGMDVASAVSAASGKPLVSFCTSVNVDGGLGATCQLYAGKIEADVEVDGETAIFAVLAGSASAEAGRSGGAGAVEQADNPVGELRTKCLGVNEPEG